MTDCWLHFTMQDEDGNVIRKERGSPSKLGDIENIEKAEANFPDLATSEASMQESWQLIAKLAGLEEPDAAALTAGRI
jgi:hypothetical protein